MSWRDNLVVLVVSSSLEAFPVVVMDALGIPGQQLLGCRPYLPHFIRAPQVILPHTACVNAPPPAQIRAGRARQQNCHLCRVKGQPSSSGDEFGGQRLSGSPCLLSPGGTVLRPAPRQASYQM